MQIARPAGDTLDMWNGYLYGKPTTHHDFVEDWDYYVAGNYTVTVVGTGSDALAASAPTVGGVLINTTSGAQNDSRSAQKIGHSYVPTAGTAIWYETRIQVDDATNAAVLVGLISTNTTPLTSVADGIYFTKPSGATAFAANSTVGSAVSALSNVGTCVANTYFTLGFKITGTTQVDYYVNGIFVNSLVTPTTAVPLRVTYQIKAGTAAIRVLSQDYIMVAQNRV